MRHEVRGHVAGEDLPPVFDRLALDSFEKIGLCKPRETEHLLGGGPAKVAMIERL